MSKSPRNAHKDLEFEVGSRSFKSVHEASSTAISIALSTGEPVEIDVLTWSRAAAVAYAGADGGDQYDEDPEASVFDRIIVRAESLGRVP